MKGVFLSLDGLDGAGKSTQCKLLAGWLREQGLDVVECADPGGTSVGKAIRQLLLDPALPLCLTSETLLFMASRAQLVQDVIRPALEAGKVVLSDRFLLANVVYQGHAGGMGPELVWQFGLLATGNLVPDGTLVLDLPINYAKTRLKEKADRMESRDQAYHERVRAGFLAEAARDPERIKVIDATQSPDAVQSAIRAEADGFLRKTS